MNCLSGQDDFFQTSNQPISVRHLSQPYNKDGYDLVRKDRKRTGGGVAMYIRNSISYKTIQDMPESLETITVEVTKPTKPFLTRGTSPQIYLYRGI